MAQPVGIEDMTALTDLTENSILDNLKKRYSAQLIYTFTGSILVAVNPFKAMPIYSPDIVKKYNGRKINENPPHIFAIAETAYANVRNFKENQAVIISGESGAGKTESTKVILQYLTAVTEQVGEDSKSWIEQQILEANTVLESFGNAKTVRNNNSSRFGKFIQVVLSSNTSIVGASIVNYLLEKSRVVRQAQTERNYHVFYEMLAGTNKDEQAKYRLLSACKDYYYLNQSGCTDIPGVNDKKQFEALKLAMSVLKFAPQDLENVFKIISSILLLGNVNFSLDEKNDCATITGKDLATVETISALLGCDQSKLLTALVSKRLTVRNESTQVPLKKDQANDNRDSIAKTVYDKLFNYIVEYINNSTATKQPVANFIGVLDIFGFELFEVNSFEQLCINYTNEKLQQFFNQFIFKLEQEEYAKEGIPVESVQYKDNQPCLDLIESKTGVLAMLDEECKVPKGNDETYLAKLHEAHKKNENYVCPKTAKGVFGIKHYAGEVTYQVVNFMDKNKDAVQEEVAELLQAASNEIVKKLFKKATDDKSGQKKNVTAGTNFKTQLSTLVTTLSSTTPHYVRCVKPNMEKKAMIFDDNLVLSQLRYAGMLETIRIRKSGYPTRFSYDIFNHRFRFISGKATGQKDIAATILKSAKVDANLYKFGATKVFLKNIAVDQTVEASDKIRRVFVIRIQKKWRGRQCRVKYLKIKKSVKVLQKYIKGFVYKRRYQKMQESALKIQCVVRGWFARDYLKQLKAEKKAAEDAARLAAEEARRKAEEEERRIMMEKADSEAKASMLAAQKAAEEAAQEELRKQAEEEAKLQQYAAAAEIIATASAGKEDATEERQQGLDDLFSFLDDFDNKAKKTVDAVPVFEDIFKIDEYGPMSKSKKSSNNLVSLEAGKIPDAPPPPPPPLPPSKTSKAAAPGPRLKFNPLAKKTAEKAVEETKQDLTLKTFLEKNLEKHPRMVSTGGTFSKKQFVPTKDFLSLEEQMSFQKTPLPTSMLKIPNSQSPESQKLIDLACESFKLLSKLLDLPLKKPEEAYQALRKVIEIGIKHAELRDEILIQAIKQSHPPLKDVPKNFADIEAACWQFIALCCGCFPPSKGFQKVFFNYLHEVVDKEKARAGTTNKMSDVLKMATYSELTVKKLTMTGARKLPPSLIEVQMVRTQQPVLCRFYLMDGQVKACGITSVTTASDIIRDLSTRIGLKDYNGWSIYEVLEDPWEEHVIKATEYVSDILAFWEMRNSSSVTESGYDTIRKKGKKSTTDASGNNVAIGAGETKLFMKKRIFKNVSEIPVDPIEFNLIYAQAAVDVAHDVFPMNEKTAVQFAALKAQVDWGNFDISQKKRFENIGTYIPGALLKNNPVEQWVKLIGEQQQKFLGKNAMQARLLYLEGLKQFKFYGSTLFSVKFKGFWQHPENVILGISSSGVSILLKNKTQVEMFTYKEIQHWETDGDTITIAVLRNSTTTPSNGKDVANDKAESYKFECRMVDDISTLMKDYSPKIGVDRKKEREFYASEAEIQALNKDLDKAKLMLIKKRIVKLPAGILDQKGQPLSVMFKLPGEGLTSPEPAISSSRANLLGATGKDAAVANAIPEKEALKLLEGWKGWVAKLTCPLLVQLDGDMVLSSIAQSAYNSLLEYSGEKKAEPQIGSNSTASKRTLMQVTQAQEPSQIASIIQRLFMFTKLIDDFYLQLLKMTTDFPQPDSKTALQYWKALAVLCGCVRPQIPEVLDYLKGHLKRYMVIDPKTPVAQQRKEEAKHARFAYRALQRVLMTEPRKFPPSVEEASYMYRLSPVLIRVYFPDGQFRAVGFDSSANVEEVVNIVKEKLKLERATGFALFEASGDVERYLSKKEKMMDLLSRRESAAKISQPAGSSSSSLSLADPNKQTRFVMKKKLFLSPFHPHSDIEEDFLLVQALNDIANEKFPLSLDDALYLCGLRCQVENGDFVPTKNIDYKKVAEKFIPKALLDDSVGEKLSKEHLSLRGKSVSDCNRLFMHRVRAWPQYGSAVFDVVQSYTNDIPSNCWLLVNKDGIAINERGKKNPISSYSFKEIASLSPDDNSIMIVTDHSRGGVKYVFQTLQAEDIVNLIHEYQDVTKDRGSTMTLAPSKVAN